MAVAVTVAWATECLNLCEVGSLLTLLPFRCAFCILSFSSCVMVLVDLPNAKPKVMPQDLADLGCSILIALAASAVKLHSCIFLALF